MGTPENRDNSQVIGLHSSGKFYTGNEQCAHKNQMQQQYLQST